MFLFNCSHQVYLIDISSGNKEIQCVFSGNIYILQFKLFIMLNKSKLNLSVILLAVGLGLIPTGLFINGYLSDEVSSNVSTVLVAIEEEAVSDIEESYLGLAIPEVLPDLFDDLIPNIQTEIVYPIGIPKTLLYIKDKMLDVLPSFINGSIAAINVSNTINQIVTETSNTTTYVENAFFNDPNFQSNFDVETEGVSEFITSGLTNLSYSTNTTNRLLHGYSYNSTNYPGILQNLAIGGGLLVWLDFYANAASDSGNNRTLIQTVFDCDWSSNLLQYFATYIKSYLWEVIAKSVYASDTLEIYTEKVFLSQWANGTMLSGGFSLHQISDDFTEPLGGLEVGTPIPSNISTATAEDLWNVSNSLSFVSEVGVKTWFDAYVGDNTTEYEIKSTLELSNSSYDALFYWLTTTVKDDLVPVIFSLPFPVGFGVTPTEYAIDTLLAQWANATTFNEGINLGYGLKGFEAGIPTKTNITLGSAIGLFNTANTSSFIQRDGILDWIEAYEGDTIAQNDILSTFNLDLAQFDIITDWLFTTLRYYVIPAITYNLTRTTMLTYAQNEFYRQWSDGKLFEEGMVLGPILGLDSLSGWEIGIPTDSNIDESISSNLWNEKDEYSLLNFKGNSLWFKAMKESSTYNLLENYFGLNDTEMDAILDWLLIVREDYSLDVSQIEANLPIDHYTLGDNMLLGLLIAGGVLSGLGVIGVILQIILKRK